jgi:hypothetical protein
MFNEAQTTTVYNNCVLFKCTCISSLPLERNWEKSKKNV